MIFDLQKEDFTVTDNKFEYTGKPVPVPEPQQIKGRIVYPRDRKKLVNALVHAGFVCELNPEHPTFKRKSSGKPYTEPHHLVPMSAQEHFKVSLDVEENIVSLCSNCHNHIHYGIKVMQTLSPKMALAHTGKIGEYTKEINYYGTLASV